MPRVSIPTMVRDSQTSVRGRAPVFVVGCPRSGTTLLYHMLLSSGSFAIYRAESVMFNVIEPRFGDLSVESSRRRLLDAWFESRLFTASGLEKDAIGAKVMDECRNGGDFLRIVMSEIARRQGVQRWADTTPDHLLYLKRIKQTIPDALVIHMIRDGRDVALSMEKLGYIRPMWWDRTPAKMAAALYWQWAVTKGRNAGRALGSDYMELHFEDLVREPHKTLAGVSKFIAQDLNYEQIRRVGIGAVRVPNTAFEDEGVDPVGRWRKGYSDEELAMFEGLTGRTLVENGYELGAGPGTRRASIKMRRDAYTRYFDMKLFLRSRTPLGRLLVTRDLSWA